MEKYLGSNGAPIVKEYIDNAAAKAAEDIVVEKNIATKDYVAEQIDSIEIGGTNLYTGSRDFSGDDWYAGSHKGFTEDWQIDGYYNGFTVLKRSWPWTSVGQARNMTPGVYTLSVFAKFEEGCDVQFIAHLDDISPDYSAVKELGQIGGGDFQRYTWTFEIKVEGVYSPRIQNKIDGLSTWICGYKLERGNKATDWSPAPEDVDAKIGTTNLFAMSKSVPGYLSDNSNGNITLFYRNGETTSDYIPCRPGDVFTIQTWITSTSTDNVQYLIDYQWFADRTAGSHIGTKQRYSGGQPGFNHAAVAVGPAPETAQYLRVTARLYNNGKIKVEHSDKPTEWTPAPEDVDNSISRSLRSCTVTYDCGGRNLKEIFGTAEALHTALAAEDYTNIAVGDYWPITLNGTFRDYGSYFVPLTAKFYTTPALGDENAGGTSSKTWEGNYYSEGVVTYTINTPPYDVRYVRESDCLPYFERTCNNVTVKLEVAAINHYWRYGDAGELTGSKPHIVFVSRDCLPFWMRMRKAVTKWEDEAQNNPWRGSAMYKTLNDETHGVLPLVAATDVGAYIYAGPNNLGMRALLETKAHDAANATGLAWYDRGKLFLPSVAEVWGHPFLAEMNFERGLGNQFAIFRDSRRHISKGGGNNASRAAWWLGSSCAGSTTEFAYVASGGNANNSATIGTQCVPICFIFA